MTARIVPDAADGRADAVRVLEAGGIVALPTDTVYGLAANLANVDAIERLFAAKRRPADRAVVLLLAEARQAGELAAWPPAAEALARAFWPGALTIVVAQRSEAGLPSELTGGRPTVGLRVADHPSPRALAAALGPLPSPRRTCRVCRRRPTRPRFGTNWAMRSSSSSMAVRPGAARRQRSSTAAVRALQFFAPARFPTTRSPTVFGTRACPGSSASRARRAGQRADRRSRGRTARRTRT